MLMIHVTHLELRPRWWTRRARTAAEVTSRCIGTCLSAGSVTGKKRDIRSLDTNPTPNNWSKAIANKQNWNQN